MPSYVLDVNGMIVNIVRRRGQVEAISASLPITRAISQKGFRHGVFAQGKPGSKAKIDRFHAAFGVVKQKMGSIGKVRASRRSTPVVCSSAVSGN